MNTLAAILTPEGFRALCREADLREQAPYRKGQVVQINNHQYRGMVALVLTCTRDVVTVRMEELVLTFLAEEVELWSSR